MPKKSKPVDHDEYMRFALMRGAGRDKIRTPDHSFWPDWAIIFTVAVMFGLPTIVAVIVAVRFW